MFPYQKDWEGFSILNSRLHVDKDNFDFFHWNQKRKLIQKKVKDMFRLSISRCYWSMLYWVSMLTDKHWIETCWIYNRDTLTQLWTFVTSQICITSLLFLSASDFSSSTRDCDSFFLFISFFFKISSENNVWELLYIMINSHSL